jgi:hypothetical protein
MSINLFICEHYQSNKDENVHRFALSALRGELLERERVRERESKQQIINKIETSSLSETSKLSLVALNKNSTKKPHLR